MALVRQLKTARFRPKSRYDIIVDRLSKCQVNFPPWKAKFTRHPRLTRWLPAYGIFVLRFRPKKQQFSVALPMP